MTTVEWNDAPEVRAFYGRAEEVGELASELLGTDRRLVMIQGLRGSGKTRLSLAAVCVRTNAGLATDLQSEVVGRFDHVVWASLLNAPTLVDLLRRIAGSLPPTAGPPTSDDEAGMVDHVLAQARTAPCLIILDNLESVLEAGSGSPFRLDHEGYGEFFARFAAERHHSCILVTSREIPTSLADRCGPREPATVHRVRPLNEGACASILADHGLRAEIDTLRRLVQAFGGNPLMIDLVARRAREVYGDDLDRLLDEGDLCFDRVRELLAWHFDRLTPRELGLAYRFAVSREAIGLGEMAADLGVGQAVAGDVLRELEARLPLERHGERRTMHPVLMEHVTDRLVAEAIQDATSNPPGVLDRVSLYKATGKDYVRAAQERLLLAPISRGLAERVGRMPGVSGLLSAMLRAARGKGGRGHLAGNAINLMWAAGIDMSGLDLSSLPIRDAFLQRITLHGCDFSFSEFHGCVFATTLGTVLSVAVTPDGASVLTGDNHGDVRSWRTADGTELTRFEGHRDWVRTIAAAPSGTTFATAGSDYEIRIWETSTGHCLHVLRGHAEQVYSVHYDPTGRLLASGAEDGQVILWDASNSYQRIREWRCEGRVRSVRFSPRKECVLVGCKDVEILPVVGDGPLAVSAVDGHVRRAVFDPSGETVAYATEAGTVHVADGGTLRELRRLDLPRKPNWIEYSLDGSTLAAGCEDGRIRRWSVAQAYAGMPDLDGAPGASIRAIAYGPDPGLIASGGEDRTVRLWDLRSREVLRSVQGYANGIRSVAWAADGASFAAACEDGEVRSWDVAHPGPTPSGRLQGHTGTVEAVTFDPSGHALASAGDDGTVRIWDLATGRSRTLRGHRGWIWCATYSRDGRLLATGGRDHRVLVWDTADGAQLHELADHDDEVHCVEFLGTTGLIATGGDDKRVRLWQPGESGARVIGAHGDCVRALCFSEPRGLLASAGDDGVVKLWTLDGQAAGEMAGHRGRIRSIVFDRSGQTLFSAGDDAVIRKWDVDRRTAKEFCGHSGGLWSVALSPEGDALVSGGAEGVLRIWDVASGRSSERWPERRYEGACMAGVQGLTPAEVHSLERLGATMRKRAPDGDRTPLSPPDATAPTSAEASGIGQSGVSAAGGSEPGPPATPASAREEDGPSDIVDAGPALRTTSPITTRLLDVLISIRPLGPDEILWTEAGGDFARLNLIGNGREQWSTALRELGLGGGGKDITVLSLVDAALANYPRNPGLQTLRAELVMGGPS